MKKILYLWLFIFLLAQANAFADKAVLDPVDFSGPGMPAPGVWYDEAWQGSGYYRLEEDPPGSNQYVFKFVAEPPGSVESNQANATFFLTSDALEQKPPRGQSVDRYKETASIPQDIVMTEQGGAYNLHFRSGN